MSRMEITGYKRFKGTIDGKALDSAKVFVRVKIDDSRNSEDQRSAGYCTEELKVDPSILKRIEHNPMPMICEVETERVSNGREAKDVVVDLRPIEAAPVKSVKAA